MSSARDAASVSPDTATGVSQRILSIDRARGLLVLLMVTANYLGGIAAVPAFLKHTPDVGLTIVDVGAPCFVFVMGLTYRESFERRMARGESAYLDTLMRYLALVGIGAILSSGGTQVAGQPSDWGVLQALGVAGIVALPFVSLGTLWRFAAGAVLLVGYQALLDLGAVDPVRASVQGGLIGGLSWGAVLVLATAVADVWRRGTGAMAMCCTVLTATAAGAVLVVPVSKARVSLSYMLVCLAIAAVGFFAVDLMSRVWPHRAGLLTWWGSNALVLYLLHLILLALVVLPGPSWWYEDAAAWLAAAQLITILGVLSWVAWRLWRSRVLVRL